ncbi:MAG: TIM barrel protein [Chryseolinea sp.]
MDSKILNLSGSKKVNRREFLGHMSAATLALTLPGSAGFIKDKRMGIVVHSYASRWNSKTNSHQFPGFKDALDLLTHCHHIGAAGIQVGVKGWTKDFSNQVRDRREKFNMYVEGSIAVPFQAGDVSEFEKEVIAAKEAGATVLRSVCTSGRRYEVYHSAADFEKAHTEALAALRLAAPILQKHKMKLAVENHKDWRAPELVGIIKKLDSEWIGVTLDFGNSIALMEDPMEVVTTLAPYLFTTHVKDMGVDECEDGILLSEVPLGQGILDLPAIVAICKKNNSDATFNLEMITRDPLKVPCLTDDYWQTLPDVIGKDLARTLHTARTKKFANGLPRVSHLTVDERLAVEEKNILSCLEQSKNSLGLK